MGRVLRIVTMSIGLGLVLSQQALACPVCFGASDSPMAGGVNLAILALLGVTATVLGSFAAFFIYLVRRSRMAVKEAAGAPAAGGQGGTC